MQQVIVFAYGSNLDDQQMRSRCASTKIEARAVLPNHVLAFGGFSQRRGGAIASVVPEPGARVEGLLYRITSPDLRALDRQVDRGMTERPVQPSTLDDELDPSTVGVEQPHGHPGLGPRVDDQAVGADVSGDVERR